MNVSLRLLRPGHCTSVFVLTDFDLVSRELLPNLETPIILAKLATVEYPATFELGV
jgi:hypothetical protein